MVFLDRNGGCDKHSFTAPVCKAAGPCNKSPDSVGDLLRIHGPNDLTVIFRQQRSIGCPCVILWMGIDRPLFQTQDGFGQQSGTLQGQTLAELKGILIIVAYLIVILRPL